VLGERVQDARVAARGEIGHVAPHVARHANAEVGAACAHAPGSPRTAHSPTAGSAAGSRRWRVTSRVALPAASIQSQLSNLVNTNSLRWERWFYPRTAPAVSPNAILRCTSRKKMTTGIAVSVEPAISAPQSMWRLVP